MSLSRLPPLSDLESTLIIRFIEFADKNGLTRVDSKNLHTNTKEFGVRPLMLRSTFTKLCEKSILMLTNDNGSSYYEIDPTFSDEIDSYYEFIREKPSDPGIPASDRFVSIDDNSPEFEQVKSSLREIEKRVLESNELVANKDERLAIIREVKGIGELLDQPMVRVASLWNTTKQSGILWWLGQHVADATLRVLATDTIGKLLSLLGLS